MTLVPPRWLLSSSNSRMYRFPYVLPFFCQLLLWLTIPPIKAWAWGFNSFFEAHPLTLQENTARIMQIMPLNFDLNMVRCRCFYSELTIFCYQCISGTVRGKQKTDHFFWLLYTFILCNFSVQALHYFQKLKINQFFANVRNLFFTVQPSPQLTAHISYYP